MSTYEVNCYRQVTHYLTLSVEAEAADEAYRLAVEQLHAVCGDEQWSSDWIHGRTELGVRSVQGVTRKELEERSKWSRHEDLATVDPVLMAQEARDGDATSTGSSTVAMPPADVDGEQ